MTTRVRSSGFRRYLRDDRTDSVMLEVTGLPAGARIRIAALDSYDGVVYAVGSPTVDSASGHVRAPAVRDRPLARRGGAGRTVRDDRRLLRGLGADRRSPLGRGVPGQRGVRARGRLRLQRDERHRRRPARAPRRRQLPAERGPPGSADARRAGGRRAGIGGGPADRARFPTTSPRPSTATSAGSTAGRERVSWPRSTRSRAEGFISHGLADDEPESRSGHSLDRIAELFSGSRMIGDAEQYAVAAALMADRLGFPARVVVGLRTGGGGRRRHDDRARLRHLRLDRGRHGGVRLGRGRSRPAGATHPAGGARGADSGLAARVDRAPARGPARPA